MHGNPHSPVCWIDDWYQNDWRHRRLYVPILMQARVGNFYQSPAEHNLILVCLYYIVALKKWIH